jgi:hypothetical protein
MGIPKLRRSEFRRFLREEYSGRDGRVLSRGAPVSYVVYVGTVEKVLEADLDYLDLSPDGLRRIRARLAAADHGYQPKTIQNWGTGLNAYAQFNAAHPVVVLPPTDDEAVRDARRRILADIIQREGQPEFRAALIAAYQGRCAVTGCEVLAVLEAAHIIPYLGRHSNLTSNGLLLRADIHTLFDRHLLGVRGDTITIWIADALEGSEYAVWRGRPIGLPVSIQDAPNSVALEEHRTGEPTP